MKKKCIGAFLLGCLSLVCSCANDDDAEVYVTSSFQQELKSIRERYTYPTSLASEDYYYSDLDKITPTGVVSVYDDSHNKVGEYGYVDLGLSVKWANFNLGAKTALPSSELKNFDDIYKEVLDDMFLESNEYHVILPDTIKGPLPCVISYEQYSKSTIDYLRSQFPSFEEFEEFGDYCTNMRKAYKEAVTEYNSYLLKNKFTTLAGRYYWNWGGINSFVWKEDHYKDLPMNIAGTKYDEVTTRLGDGWRMPTKAELQELIDKCKWTLYEKERIKGYIVTRPSGKSIFVVYDTSMGTESMGTDYPYIYLSSERTNTWSLGVEVYALNIQTQKIVNDYPSGILAAIRPVYTK